MMSIRSLFWNFFTVIYASLSILSCKQLMRFVHMLFTLNFTISFSHFFFSCWVLKQNESSLLIDCFLLWNHLHILSSFLTAFHSFLLVVTVERFWSWSKRHWECMLIFTFKSVISFWTWLWQITYSESSSNWVCKTDVITCSMIKAELLNKLSVLSDSILSSISTERVLVQTHMQSHSVWYLKSVSAVEDWVFLIELLMQSHLVWYLKSVSAVEDWVFLIKLLMKSLTELMKMRVKVLTDSVETWKKDSAEFMKSLKSELTELTEFLIKCVADSCWAVNSTSEFLIECVTESCWAVSSTSEFSVECVADSCWAVNSTSEFLIECVTDSC